MEDFRKPVYPPVDHSVHRPVESRWIVAKTKITSEQIFHRSTERFHQHPHCSYVQHHFASKFNRNMIILVQFLAEKEELSPFQNVGRKPRENTQE
jgi:hypothetical protein